MPESSPTLNATGASAGTPSSYLYIDGVFFREQRDEDENPMRVGGSRESPAYLPAD
jgi:hypothetical protein